MGVGLKTSARFIEASPPGANAEFPRGLPVERVAVKATIQKDVPAGMPTV